MNLSVNQRIEKKKEKYQSYFKQKADILTLKTKPDEKVEWPVRSYQNRWGVASDRVHYTALTLVLAGNMLKRGDYMWILVKNQRQRLGSQSIVSLNAQHGILN